MEVCFGYWKRWIGEIKNSTRISLIKQMNTDQILDNPSYPHHPRAIAAKTEILLCNQLSVQAFFLC